MFVVQAIEKNIYQGYTYRNDLSWLHINNEPRVQEKLKVKALFCRLYNISK